MKKATERFSDKVQHYATYRPGYPVEIVDYLRSKGNLPYDARIADIGSGTGIFTKLMLDAGYVVYGVEPNVEMRQAAEDSLMPYPKFVSVDGTGEDTTLSDGVVDMIVSATAFHWIDPVKAKIEFARILKPSGKTVLLWNVRLPDADEFSIAYDKFWKVYQKTDKHDVMDKELKEFFSGGNFETKSFQHCQTFDLAGLIGRSFSSSFAPGEDTVVGKQFSQQLKTMFETYQEQNAVNVHYMAKVYIGDLH